MGPDKTIYDRDYVIDYTSPERNDLAEFNLGHYQWQWGQADSRESAAKVHDLTHLYNAAGQRLQTESARYTDWAGAIHYTRYIHEDIMGSSHYYTNPETGYVTNRHEYTTWGNNTKAPTYNYDPEYRASEPYFTGHPYDGSLNLYYAENRFYDPETGSFLSSDPAKSGLNWYQYCGSNPVTYVDPLGLEYTPLQLFIIGDNPFFFNKVEDSENKGKDKDELWKQINEITKKEVKISAEGYRLLIALELGTKLENYDYIKLDEAGNIAFIRNPDVKDGGITVGVGIYVNEQNKERIKLLENYGINWSSVDEWVSYDIVEMVFEQISNDYMKEVVNLLNKNQAPVNQEVIDSLFILTYNRPALFSEGGTIDQLLGSGNQNIEDWESEILKEYQGISTWKKFEN